MKFSVILHDTTDPHGYWFDAQEVEIKGSYVPNDGAFEKALLQAATVAKSSEETEDGKESWQHVSMDDICQWISDEWFDHVPNNCRCYGFSTISIFVHLVKE